MHTKVNEQIEFYRLIEIPTLERAERGLPLTLKEIAEHLGVVYPTIIKWHKKAKVKGISIRSADKKVEALFPLNDSDKEWDRFMKQLTADAAEKGATAPTRTLYAQLKGKMPKTAIDLKIGLSADEIARRNLEATRQLEEGGFK